MPMTRSITESNTSRAKSRYGQAQRTVGDALEPRERVHVHHHGAVLGLHQVQAEQVRAQGAGGVVDKITQGLRNGLDPAGGHATEEIGDAGGGFAEREGAEE